MIWSHCPSAVAGLSALLIALEGISGASEPAPLDEPLIIVEQGDPRAVIVVADKPTESAVQAAEILQGVVQQMSGTLLPIQSESEFRGEQTAILVGASTRAEKMGVSVEQDYSQGDRYVIRSGPGHIALVGNDDSLRGSVYAVYDLLERLGCGWYGPDPVWHVIPQRETLLIPAIQADVRPEFLMRDIWMVRPHPILQDAWRLGGQSVSHGHAFSRLVPPEKYQEEHPDWFGENQPCLTHPEVIRLVADQFRARLEEQPGLQSFSLCANDAGGFCTCERCQAVGNVSAQQLNFANAIARELAPTYPGRFLLSIYAYWFSHEPPQPLLKAEPGVVGILINEGDHTKPLDQPERPEVARKGRCNTREVQAFAGWSQTEGLAGIYEWWIPGCNNPNWRRVPWYSGETALRNLRYWQRGGVKYLTYETQYEDGNGFPIRWPLYYVAARSMWDLDLTNDQIMTQACEKLYGPAAPDMLRFYQVLERAMAETPESGGNWHLPSPELIYTPPLEEAATGHLLHALQASIDPTIMARVQQEWEMWDQARAVMDTLRAEAAGSDADALGGQ